MKICKSIYMFLGVTCLTSFPTDCIYADANLSDRAKATYYDTKVKAKDAYDDASDRVKATYYDTKVKVKDACDETPNTPHQAYDDASDRVKATYYDTKVKVKDAYQETGKVQ